MSAAALTEQLSTAKPFIDAYKAAGYADPYGAYGAYAYDAANVIIAAMAKVLSGQGRVTDELRAKLRQAVQDATLDGVTGKIAFDPYGDRTIGILTVSKVEKDASGTLAWKAMETREYP
jgi:branched-chain amino acid transport system substrate-binding protein